MSQYKRCYQSGGNYFFTLVTYERRPIFINPDDVVHLKAAINKVKKKYPFSLNAIVILPDHLHCIWRLIKRYFSLEISGLINHRKEKEIWRRRFWEHLIRDENDWRKHMDYIHYNPVKHGLVHSPEDWPHSSFCHYVEKGLYEKNWGSIKPITFARMNEAE